jgi:hypothetical protein
LRSAPSRDLQKGFFISQEALYQFRIFKHRLKQILFVTKQMHDVVIVPSAGGHSLHDKPQIGLGQMQHRFSPNQNLHPDGLEVSAPAAVVRATAGLWRALREF